jgi:ribonuclease BN (tRNA processing enzyme)
MAVSGDGAPTAATERLFHGCDALVHEAYQEEIVEPVHSSLSKVIAMGKRAEIRELYLVHLNRRFKRSAMVVVRKSGGSQPRTFLAQPLQIVTL